MDESTIESIRHRVPILDGEFYGSWKTKMLEIFNEYNFIKYIISPYVPPIDHLHPTPDEYLDMVCNLRTIDLIIRVFLEICLCACLLLNAHILYGVILRNAFRIIP